MKIIKAFRGNISHNRPLSHTTARTRSHGRTTGQEIESSVRSTVEEGYPGLRGDYHSSRSTRNCKHADSRVYHHPSTKFSRRCKNKGDPHQESIFCPFVLLLFHFDAVSPLSTSPRVRGHTGNQQGNLLLRRGQQQPHYTHPRMAPPQESGATAFQQAAVYTTEPKRMRLSSSARSTAAGSSTTTRAATGAPTAMTNKGSVYKAQRGRGTYTLISKRNQSHRVGKWPRFLVLIRGIASTYPSLQRRNKRSCSVCFNWKSGYNSSHLRIHLRFVVFASIVL